MRTAHRFWRLLVGLAALSGCAPIAGPVDVEVVDAQGPGEFELATVTLNTVTDLVGGRGERFDLNANLSVNALNLVADVQRARDYEELLEISRATSGREMRARLVLDGDRYVAEDFDSLHYLTTFHIFEEVFDFADDHLRPDHPALEKGLVGFYGQLNLVELLPIPLQATDNAAYVPFADAWLTFRVFLADEGVPFAMNPGVVAHEFHHRVFFRAALAGEAFPLWQAWMSDPTTRSGNLMRGLDEGLADLFAVAYTGDPAFMSPSLEGLLAREADFRDLEGDFAQAVTYDQLETTTDLDRSHRVHCGPESDDLFAEDGFNFYCVGTVVATALWETAERDPAALRGEVLPAVEAAVDALGPAIVAASEDSGELTFGLELFFQPVAEGLPAARRDRLCDALGVRFESLLGEIPACTP